ncbi:hypothetical protein EON79_14165 [bacterium]|nr:MAG: hypothetical protein EON79_14165 [bacterium]
MERTVRENAVGVSVAGAMVLLASFLPWGTIRATPKLPFDTPGSPFGKNPFEAFSMKVDITGWNGTSTLAGITVPNWFTVALAGMVVVIVWLRATDAWHPPKYLAPVLATVGLLQSMTVLLALSTGEGGSVGIGVILAAVAFLGMAMASLRPPRAAPVPAV